MSEKRFTFYYERGNEVVIEDNGKRLSNKKVVDLLNEQQATISRLEEENEQLRKELQEKQEDEKLYAQEILELNKEVKDNQFLRLGNDY